MSYIVTKYTFFEMAQACGLTHLIFIRAEFVIDAISSTVLIVPTAFMLSDLVVSQLSHEQNPSSGSHGAASSRAESAKSKRSRSLYQQHPKKVYMRLESAYMCYGDAINLLVPLLPLYPLLYPGKVQIQFEQ